MAVAPEYQLYCFAQSGNAYRVALMLNLIGAEWKPIWVDFFAGGEPRSPKFRAEANERGEVPVLVHGARKRSQSGVCLTYLADRTGKFQPQGEDERLDGTHQGAARVAASLRADGRISVGEVGHRRPHRGGLHTSLVVVTAGLFRVIVMTVVAPVWLMSMSMMIVLMPMMMVRAMPMIALMPMRPIVGLERRRHRDALKPMLRHQRFDLWPLLQPDAIGQNLHRNMAIAECEDEAPDRR